MQVAVDDTTFMETVKCLYRIQERLPGKRLGESSLPWLAKLEFLSHPQKGRQIWAHGLKDEAVVLSIWASDLDYVIESHKAWAAILEVRFIKRHLSARSLRLCCKSDQRYIAGQPNQRCQ